MTTKININLIEEKHLKRKNRTGEAKIAGQFANNHVTTELGT